MFGLLRLSHSLSGPVLTLIVVVASSQKRCPRRRERTLLLLRVVAPQTPLAWCVCVCFREAEGLSCVWLCCQKKLRSPQGSKNSGRAQKNRVAVLGQSHPLAQPRAKLTSNHESPYTATSLGSLLKLGPDSIGSKRSLSFSLQAAFYSFVLRQLSFPGHTTAADPSATAPCSMLTFRSTVPVHRRALPCC